MCKTLRLLYLYYYISKCNTIKCMKHIVFLKYYKIIVFMLTIKKKKVNNFEILSLLIFNFEIKTVIKMKGEKGNLYI